MTDDPTTPARPGGEDALVERLRTELQQARDHGADMQKRWCEARDALWTLDASNGQPDLLDAIAEEIDCGTDCDHYHREWDTNAVICGLEDDPKAEIGCRSSAAEHLRDLAKATRALAAVRAQPDARAAALEEGRQIGLEQAAAWHDARVAAWESVAGEAFGRAVNDLNRQYAARIRALASAPPAAQVQP